MTKHLALVIFGSTLLCGACGRPGGDGAPESAASSQTVDDEGPAALELSEGDGEITLRLTGGAKPRMADVRLRWSGGWTLDSHEAGEAAELADKEVRVSKDGAEGARITVFSSSNINGIAAGDLVKLKLKGGSGGEIDIVAQPPMLAPAEAETGLHIGNPLKL